MTVSDGMDSQGTQSPAGMRPSGAINRGAAVVVVILTIILLRILFGPGIWPYVGWSVVPAAFLYAIFRGPSAYRRHGYKRDQEAIDHNAGRFGMNYPEDSMGPERRPQFDRNDPCRCGSGLKAKRCCDA